MIEWPKQKDCTAFYGDPRSATFESYLAVVPFPWLTVLAWDKGKRVRGAKVHIKCVTSLERVFSTIWRSAGRNQDIINSWGLNLFGGGYVFRTVRGGSSLSMHSYGCAVDFDPANNGLGDSTPAMARNIIVLKAFEAEGWVWGGRWKRPDGMHFQAAIP